MPSPSKKSLKATARVVNGPRKVKKRVPSLKPGAVKQPPGRRGPKGHFQGEQADFLWAKGPAFQAASDAGTSGDMTLACAKEMVSLFGEAAFHDKAVAQVTEASQGDEMVQDCETANSDDNETASQSEADLHAARLDKFSTVSFTCRA